MVIGMSKTPYFRCRKRADSKSCEGCGTLRVREVEEIIHGEMVKRLAAYQSLTRKNPEKINPKLTALQVELAQTEAEIEKLLDTLTGANAVLLNYANDKIEALDVKRQSLSKAIADASVGAVSPEQLEHISALLNSWDNISFEDRRLVVDRLISVIRATGDSAQIEWKI